MTVDQINMKMTQGSMRPRSATAPTARATLYILSAVLLLAIGGILNIRDGREHALVDRKHEIRNFRASNRRCSEGVSETNVLKIADELAGCMREGEGIAPEEPLEGCDTGSHHGEPYQRKSRLSPRESGVEEAVVAVS